MKHLFVCLTMLAGSVMMADTVVIRQPGLVEGVCSAACGTVRCVGEFATGLVAGNTTVVQTPAVANTVVTTAPAVIPAAQVVMTPGYVQAPVVCAPVTAVPVYTPVCGAYREWYNGCACPLGWTAFP